MAWAETEITRLRMKSMVARVRKKDAGHPWYHGLNEELKSSMQNPEWMGGVSTIACNITKVTLTFYNCRERGRNHVLNIAFRHTSGSPVIGYSNGVLCD